MEVGLSLSRLAPHKKRFYYFKDLNPYFYPLFMALATEGYEAKELSLEDMDSPKDWVDQIDAKRDLFVLYSADEPLLGRLYPVDKMERLTSDKGLFRLCLSHNKHKYIKTPDKQDRHKVNLYSMDSQICVSHFSKEAHIDEPISDSLNWNNMGSPLSLFGSLQENKDLIVTFENKLNSKPLFQSTPRIFDRAIVFWEDLDGFALIDQVAKDMGLSLSPPGEDQNFETPSLSRWISQKSMTWLKTLGISPNQMRGLVIFSQELLRSSSFIDIVQSARKTVLKRQSGTHKP